MLRKIANAILLALNLSLTACALTRAISRPRRRATTRTASPVSSPCQPMRCRNRRPDARAIRTAQLSQRTSQARLNWAGCLTAKFPLATAAQAT